MRNPNLKEAIRRQLTLVRAAAYGYCNDGGGSKEAAELFLAIGGTIDDVIKLLETAARGDAKIVGLPKSRRK